MSHNSSEFVTRNELADRLRVSYMTIYMWARRGYGPPSIKLSPRKHVYRRADVEAFIAENSASLPTSAEDAKKAAFFAAAPDGSPFAEVRDQALRDGLSAEAFAALIAGASAAVLQSPTA